MVAGEGKVMVNIMQWHNCELRGLWFSHFQHNLKGLKKLLKSLLNSSFFLKKALKIKFKVLTKFFTKKTFPHTIFRS